MRALRARVGRGARHGRPKHGVPREARRRNIPAFANAFNAALPACVSLYCATLLWKGCLDKVLAAILRRGDSEKFRFASEEDDDDRDAHVTDGRRIGRERAEDGERVEGVLAAARVFWPTSTWESKSTLEESKRRPGGGPGRRREPRRSDTQRGARSDLRLHAPSAGRGTRRGWQTRFRAALRAPLRARRPGGGGGGGGTR